MDLRTNEEFAIIDSIVVGNGIEYVVGQRDTDFEPYVVWECINGNEYRQGDYCNDPLDARTYMRERAGKELQRQRDAGKLPPAFVIVSL